MKYLLLIYVMISLLSCKKEDNNTVAPEESFDASYTIRIQLNWQSPAFSIPVNAHVTNFMGMVHFRDVHLWNIGARASAGVENLAEEGKNAAIDQELDGFIASRQALTKFMLAPPAIDGTLDTTLSFNKTFSCISFASMLAPSPDWFLGLNNVNLLGSNGWVKDTTVNLMLCDAGTEDGDIFGYDNPPSNPLQNITPLTISNASSLANGNPIINIIGTVAFVKN